MAKDDFRSDDEPLASVKYKPMPNSTQSLLDVRQTTHGDFTDNARFAQGLKTIFQDSEGYALLTPVQREAIDFICSKFGRIMSGQPNFPDHWADIAGYARLVADRCPSQ
jgi:hypothetical protein